MLLEIKSKRLTAIVSVSNKVRVLQCTNFSNCRIQGFLNCPPHCPVVLDAKKFIRGFKTKNTVEILSRKSRE
ncbi:MAG: hypothetical protein NZ895_02510 [Archaeoglobaceae archaeon]|nr:hypothetical protein [Archaeoglobaceae archaeon]MCX8152662.1 hypothetical protein [Archaeoglobaceae archaeon]MDW8013663.1 hypothetical protein [Archaeoglobaceae archaeon]